MKNPINYYFYALLVESFFQTLPTMFRKLRRGLLWIFNLLNLWLIRVGLSLKIKKQPKTDIRRILIVGYAAIGDAIFLLPALSSLKKAFPKAWIVFMANDYPTAKELIPETGIADEIWIEEIPRGQEEAKKVNARIAAGEFDAVLVVPSAPVRFLCSLLSIPFRIGHCRIFFPFPKMRNIVFHFRRRFLGEDFERRILLNRWIWINEAAPEHAVLRGLNLLAPLGISGSSEIPVEFGHLSQNLSEEKNSPMRKIGIHIGSEKSQYNKIWPAKNWAILARALLEKYSVRIRLLGGPDEKPESLAFAAAADFPYEDIIGKKSLAETFSEIGRCDLFLSSDTGLSKAAMAMKIPTVTLYGPTSPREMGLFWDSDRHLEIKLNLPCMPCVSSGIRKEGSGVINYMTCGHHDCMGRLSPEMVFHAVWNWGQSPIQRFKK